MRSNVLVRSPTEAAARCKRVARDLQHYALYRGGVAALEDYNHAMSSKPSSSLTELWSPIFEEFTCMLINSVPSSVVFW
jgi:hypothetical protein